MIAGNKSIGTNIVISWDRVRFPGLAVSLFSPEVCCQTDFSSSSWKAIKTKELKVANIRVVYIRPRNETRRVWLMEPICNK